ncbi:hypothetical protein BH23PAT2_BH23PAT2_00850 [soil metagenome]
MSKTSLTETEVRARHITPAIIDAGWGIENVREEFFYFTQGRIIVRGKKSFRKDRKVLETSIDKYEAAR